MSPPPFTERVRRAVQNIPKGEVRTYKEIAIQAGQPRAYRAVGTILRRIWQTDHGQTVPCHRVIRSDGQLGGYAGGTKAKRQRLADEQKNR